MYYLVFPLLYLISLLPFFVLYLLSDGISFLLARVFKYRYDVVLHNLSIAFPEKTDKERKKIARQFYSYFTDSFIESLKLISLSKKQLLKRSAGSFELINELIDKGYNINIMAGHQFNWEYANLLYSMHLKVPFVGVYMPIGNKVFNKIFLDIRSRYGTVLISATEFKNESAAVFKKQYMLALAADQNPGCATNAYWLNFFGRPVPFIMGPERGAIKNDAAVVYVGFKKIKRGYYHFETTLLAEHSASTAVGELTCKYRNILEQTIRQDPPNYLWSHRRFKFEWKEEYKELWVDK
ncbi:MAG: lipid A biosynthesis acyltransferase [Bacteroidetes bacterium]|nr:lipid A biosynthesis acyltransferase [Bacteroidota bacterium]